MKTFVRRVGKLSADEIARLVELQLAAQRNGRAALEKTARVKQVRKDIARIKTIAAEKAAAKKA